MKHVSNILLFICFILILLVIGWYAIDYVRSYKGAETLNLSQYCAEDEELQQCIAGPCCCKKGVVCQ